MALRSNADFFFKLPPTKRRAVMLDAVKEATKMQRTVLKKADKMKKSAKRGR